MINFFGKRLFTFILAIVCLQVTMAQNLEIVGQLLNADDESPLQKVEISTNDNVQELTLDESGNFTLTTEYQDFIELLLHVQSFEDISLKFSPTGSTHNLGTLYMSKSAEQEQVNLPTIVLNEQEIGDEDNGAEDVSGLLSASRDPFAQAAAFDLSWARFRMRGLASSSQEMTMNGILTNDLETGSVRWSLWSGLNDAVRARRDILNIDVSDFAFGGLGGSANIDIRPSAMRKYTRFSYAMSNGNYRHRLMGFYNSGLNDKGWGIALSASRRYAEEGYVEGTFYDAWSYFISIEKRINNKHSVNVAGFGANSRRGRNSAVTQEEYDLRDPFHQKLYNPNWGYQDGRKRNARVNTSFQPVFLLSHEWKLSDHTKLTTGGMYRTGRYGNTRLDWNSANDPRPNYYRKLPSWVNDPALAEEVAEKWRTDENTRQIDWNRIYNVNYGAMETVRDVDGVAGNNVTGLRSRYLLEEQRFDPTVLSLNTTLNSAISDQLSLYANVSFVNSRTDNYKIVDDLLGGDFVLDVDKFAESDFVNPNLPAPDIIQNDLQNPNRLARVGDVLGYDYEVHAQQLKGWLQGKYETQQIIFYLGGQAGTSSFWRNGNYQNGRYPGNSLGESEKNEDFIYAVKSGLTYKIDGRNYVTVNGMIGQDGAQARQGFQSPRVNNELNPYNSERPYLGYDVTYQVRSPFIKARLSAFHNEFNDWTSSIQFYNDFRNSFGSWVLGNIDYVTEGIEGGLELKLSPTVSASGGFSFSDNKYTSRQIASVIDDRATDYQIVDETIYTEGYKLAGSPNTVGSLGIQYRSPKFWWFEITGNYFADNYISISPTRRRIEAIELLDPSSDQYKSILAQEKLQDAFIMNLSGGYSYRIKHGEYIRFFASITNLFDYTDYISGGYEQLRFDDESRDTDVFPTRYYYNYGMTFFASITYQF